MPFHDDAIRMGSPARAEQVVTVRTRKVPKPAEGGNVYHVYPWDKDQKTLKKNRIHRSAGGLLCRRGPERS